MSNAVKKVDTDSDDDDDAQMQMFLEAADSTLLNNSMYQKSNTPEEPLKIGELRENEEQKPKSQRYLDEQLKTGASDLQISHQMQTHLWGKLSAIIENQITFFDPKKPLSGPDEEEDSSWPNKVKLIGNANCYVIDDIEEEIVNRKKPEIRKRRQQDDENQLSEDEALATVCVTGESILNGRDTICWSNKKSKDKLYKYKTKAVQGTKHILVEDTR